MAMRYLLHHAGGLDGFAVDEDLAGIGRFEADDVFEQNALAAAARAHEDEDFAGPHLEVDALEDFLLAESCGAGRAPGR